MSPLIPLESSKGSYARARANPQRQRTRAQRCPPARATLSLQQALALKRYICLVIEMGTVAQMQLTLRADLSIEAIDSLVGSCRRAHVMAFPVDRTTLLFAAAEQVARAFADRADKHRLLSRKLKTRLKAANGVRPLSAHEQELMVHLERVLAAVVQVDVPRPGAFADAGFDLATICSSQQSR